MPFTFNMNTDISFRKIKRSTTAEDISELRKTSESLRINWYLRNVEFNHFGKEMYLSIV